MKITVLMSSGDVDDWDDVADAVMDEGHLVIVSHIEDDEVPGDSKTITITETLDDGGGTKSTTFFVNATYAPGMWMKAEYDF